MWDKCRGSHTWLPFIATHRSSCFGKPSMCACIPATVRGQIALQPRHEVGGTGLCLFSRTAGHCCEAQARLLKHLHDSVDRTGLGDPRPRGVTRAATAPSDKTASCAVVPHQEKAAAASVHSASRRMLAVSASAGAHVPRLHISLKSAAAAPGCSSLRVSQAEGVISLTNNQTPKPPSKAERDMLAGR